MSEYSPDFPRVLIVGLDPATDTCDHVTLSGLFKGWPRDRLAVAAGRRELGTSGFAGHYYRLGAMEDNWVWPLSAIPRESWKISGPATPEAGCVHETKGFLVDRRSAQPTSSDEVPGSLPRRIGSAALRVSGARDFLWGLRLSDPFRAWVAAYQPDVIYSQLASLHLIRLVGLLAQDAKIPLALHFMDDWPSTIYRRGPMGPILRRRVSRELRELVKRAAVLMAISDDMSREFGARYACDFLTFHNALELREWGQTHRTSWEPGQPFEVLYAGRIGTANQAGLIDVAEALDSLRQSGVSIRFTILTHDHAHPLVSSLKRFAHLDVLPAIPHEEIPARLAAADLLVLPLDFDRQARKFARFSMPTKTVEYMASGTPTIVYAPAEHAVSRYATSGGWGLVIGQRNRQELTAGLRALVDSAEMRERLARTAVELAFAHHDADIASNAFRSALESAAASPAQDSFALGDTSKSASTVGRQPRKTTAI